MIGQNFVASSVVRWNGSDRPTTSDAINGLVAQISASDIAAAGTAAVTVFNPAPGGGTSNSLTFTTTRERLIRSQSLWTLPESSPMWRMRDAIVVCSYVSMYTINPTTGALTSIGPPVSSYDDGADSVTVDPFGKFAYVTNWGDVWNIE